MARKATGQLIWRPTGWHGRFWAVVDGERVRVSRSLGTTNKGVAKRKLSRLVAAEQSPHEAARMETFEQAARRVVDKQKADGMMSWRDRLTRLERYVFPTLAALPVDKVKAAHINSLLEDARSLGKSRQTLMHIKNDCSVVLGDLWRAELLAENVTKRVRVPKADRSQKERAVLTDAELQQYLTWEHPEEHFRRAVLERQTMACVSRMFGGLRTGDLHAERWENLDTEAGRFEFGWAPRKKTGRPQRLVIPEMLRPILRDWWERHGRPTEGPVFPVSRGDRAGEQRGKMTHARAFRQDLKRALGVEQWDATRRMFVPGRDLTARERVLFEQTDQTLPVDFHSWRRAYCQALAEADVNAQQAQALAGHADLSAHERYLRNSQRMRELPKAALPRLSIKALPKGSGGESPRLMSPANEADATEVAQLLPVQRELVDKIAGSGPTRGRSRPRITRGAWT